MTFPPVYECHLSQHTPGLGTRAGQNEFECQLERRNTQKHPQSQEQNQNPFFPGVHIGQDINCALYNDNLSSAKTHRLIVSAPRRSCFAISLALPPGHGAVTLTNSQRSQGHPSSLANENNLCCKPSGVPNGEPEASSSLSDLCGCRWHWKRQEVSVTPHSSCAPARNLTKCKNIREAHGHSKYTYAHTHTCAHSGM